MPDLKDMLNSSEAKKLTQDPAKLEQLRSSPETQRLFQLLSGHAGGDLEQAASRAALGDAGTLIAAVKELMRDPEGQKLLQTLKQDIG